MYIFQNVLLVSQFVNHFTSAIVAVRAFAFQTVGLGLFLLPNESKDFKHTEPNAVNIEKM